MLVYNNLYKRFCQRFFAILGAKLLFAANGADNMAIKSGEWLGAWQRNLSNGKTKLRKLQYYAKKECEKRRRKGAKAIIESNCGLILQNAVEFVVCRS